MPPPRYKADPFNPMLSDNFDLFTMCQSDTAGENGIQNIPGDPEVIANLSALCRNVLEPALAHFDLPLCITSGYRCPRLNRAVGGLDTSQHLSGEAADIMMAGLRNDELARWIIDNTAFDEVILEKFDPACGEYGWVHVSYSRQGNRGRVFTFDGHAYHAGFHYLDLSGPARGEA